MNCKQKGGTHKLVEMIVITKILVFNMSYPLNYSSEIPCHSEVPLVPLLFH